MKKQTLRTMLLDNDVEILSHEVPYKGYFSIEKYKLRHKLFAGNWGPTIVLELFERGRAASVLLLDPKRRQVVLIEQFRIGAIRDKKSPWLIEIVAGIIEKGETAEEVCIREAMEEAGLELLELIPISHYLVSPGGCTEEVDVFCGIVDASHAGGVHGLELEHEDIRVHVFGIDEAIELMHSGEINTPPAIIALQWLEFKKHELCALNKIERQSDCLKSTASL